MTTPESSRSLKPANDAAEPPLPSTLQRLRSTLRAGTGIPPLGGLNDARALRDTPAAAWVVDAAPSNELVGVCSLASLRGGRIAVGHHSGVIRIRDAATGAVSLTLEGHDEYVCALASLSDGRLASGSGDDDVRVWDVSTGQCDAVLAEHEGAVDALAVLHDGRLASGSWDRTVRLWDVDSRSCTAVLAHGSSVWSLAALRCGGLATGLEDGAVALWSAAGVHTATLGGIGSGAVCSLAVLPDGRLAAGHGGGGPCLIRVWDVQRAAPDAVISGHTSWVRALAVLPDGSLLSGSSDRTLKVWGEAALGVGVGAASDACAATLRAHTDQVLALTALPDGRVASGALDGLVCVWAACARG